MHFINLVSGSISEKKNNFVIIKLLEPIQSIITFTVEYILVALLHVYTLTMHLPTTTTSSKLQVAYLYYINHLFKAASYHSH